MKEKLKVSEDRTLPPRAPITEFNRKIKPKANSKTPFNLKILN